MLAVALVMAACDGATVDPTGSRPTASAEPTPSVGGSAGATSEPVDATTPSAQPSGPAGSPGSPAPTGGPNSSAVDCSGSPENRSFFAEAAAAVAWDVYCGVLPGGWFIEAPSNYRLRDGGQMIVNYRGPNRAHLELHEGAFCTDAGGCVPSGREMGEAAFGDRPGTFVALDDGRFAVVVDRGAAISWLAIGENLDEASFRTLAGALHRVSD